MGTRGLALAKDFFYQCALPLFNRQAPDLFHKTAFGLVGEGSECFGFDDDLSQDHDWGPAFCLWLPRDELAAQRPVLEALLSELPATFHAWPTRMRPEQRMGRLGPLGIEDFYSRFLGTPHLPTHWQEWRAIPEHFLAVATNGEVFQDTSGLFTSLRARLLQFYPEDIRRKKIAARCVGMAQAGQYNVLRSLKRKEAVPAMLAAARFAEQALSMVFLLNKKYMPFYKWADRSVQTLPILGPLCHRSLHQLAVLNWADSAAYSLADQPIEKLCAAVAAELRIQNLSDLTDNWLAAHAPLVQQTITLPEVRNLPILLE